MHLMIAAMMATLSLAGCVKQSSSSTLRLEIPYEPTSLDPTLAEDGAAFRVHSALRRGLMRYDLSGHLKMDLAESMQVLEKGHRYRFKLKPWKWSDGKEGSAADFVFAFERALDPATPAKLADLIRIVRRASAPSPDVVEFELKEPVQTFTHILTLPIAFPQHGDATNGPYRLVKWVHDQRLEMERDPNYALAIKLPEHVVFHIVPEEAAALSLFDSGRLDVLFKAPEFDFENLKKRGVIREFPFFATYYFGFDQRQAPWGDVHARIAVAHAINRQDIVRALGGNAAAATSWIPLGIPGNQVSLGLSTDVAAAAASWKRSLGAKTRSFVIGYDSGARNQIVAELVQADLKRVLGVKTELRVRDWKSYVAQLGSQTPSLFRFGWLCPFIDAYACLIPFQSNNPNNHTGWKSKEYDSLLAHVALLPGSDPKRMELISRAHRLLVEREAVVVPIYHYVQSLVVAKRVKDFGVDGMGRIQWERVGVE